MEMKQYPVTEYKEMKQYPVTEYKEMKAQTVPGEREAHRLAGTFITHNIVSLCI